MNTRAWYVGGVAALILAACGDQPSVQTEKTDPATVDEQAYGQRQVTASLTEGTNLAVTVDAATRRRVVSLQGTLFLLGDDPTQNQALTDAYYDAREPQLSPDGSKVVFHGYRNGNWDIWETDLSGGEPRALTRDGYDDREPQYAPDGSAVIFSSDRSGQYNIWRVEGGQLAQVSDSQQDSYSPSWATNGSIAYAETGATGSQIVTVAADGLKDVIVEERGVISGVQWSPDSTHISYQVLSSDGAELKIINVERRVGRTLSQSGADVFPFRASWLGGQMLAYTADGVIKTLNLVEGDESIWPFRVDVTLTRDTYERRSRDYSDDERTVLGVSTPIISNDGQTIYFTALGDLWSWRPSDETLTQLTDDPYADYAPVLSPDGTEILFVSDRSGRVGLHRLEIESKSISQVPVQANQISAPSWSPDGSQMAFFVDVPGNPLGGQLKVVDSETGEATSVLDPMPQQPISWSGDGQNVAVTRLNPYSARYREGMYELVVADVEEGERHTIAPDLHKSIVNAGLSPRGSMTYVQGARLLELELDENLEAVEKAGPLTFELTDLPSWSSNGAYLVYMSGDRVKRLEAEGGAVNDVTPVLTYRNSVPSERYVVRAGRVFTGLTDGYLENQDIWIDGNTIERITPAGDSGEVPVIDASTSTVVPGLFEMHAHMGETSEIQGRVWLSYGITSVRDPGSNPYVAKERQEAWDSGRRVGPRTYITGFLTDGNRVFYSMAEGIISEQHLNDALERTDRLGLDFIKTYVRLPDHWQREVVRFAHGIGIPVSSHELYPAVAHGMDHVEHIGGTSRRGYQPKVSRLGYSYQDVVELLTVSGMGMTATAVLPGFAVIVSEEPDWFETPQWEAFYGYAARRGYEVMAPLFGGAPAATARANGRLLRRLTETDALLVTGTDSPFVPYGAGLHAEFRLYARAGVEPIDILRQATLKSARAAGVDKELGTLEAGKLADLVIVDGDPLQDIRDLDKVVMTIKNGHRYTLEELLDN